MDHFLSIRDLNNFEKSLRLAKTLKSDRVKFRHLGLGKTLALIFSNPSLRTRLSMQIAAKNLGLHVLDVDFMHDSWQIGMEDGLIMDGRETEHIKEAAGVLGSYCDFIAIRSFPKLQNLEEDKQDRLLQKFKQFSNVPIINMESALGHPLQSLADFLTISEYQRSKKPKIVLTWAPHPKALPQSVAHSFVEASAFYDCDLVITHPPGYELDENLTKHAQITYCQEEAFVGADFIYCKNWSSLNPYGKVICQDSSWMITPEKMILTQDGKFMHCLPVRRNVVVQDTVLDASNSLVLKQAENRIYATQAVLIELLSV